MTHPPDGMVRMVKWAKIVQMESMFGKFHINRKIPIEKLLFQVI